MQIIGIHEIKNISEFIYSEIRESWIEKMIMYMLLKNFEMSISSKSKFFRVCNPDMETLWFFYYTKKEDEIDLENFYIKENFKNQGIWKWVYRILEERIQEKWFSKISLSATSESVWFWLKMWFVIESENDYWYFMEKYLQ